MVPRIYEIPYLKNLAFRHRPTRQHGLSQFSAITQEIHHSPETIKKRVPPKSYLQDPFILRMNLEAQYTDLAIKQTITPTSGRARIFNQCYGATLSIVVPVYNEADNIDSFLDRTEPVVVKLTRDFGGTYEIIFINDGSHDGTVDRLLSHHDRNPHIKIVNLSRNFGKENALSAGIHFSTGAAVVPMDVDLQDPPELIPLLFQKWLEGYDVVYATRESRDSDSWMKRMTSLGFFRLYNRFADNQIPDNTGDFRLMDRRVIEALQDLPERNRFMKGLFSWVGFRQVGVEYSRESRSSGKSKWNYRRLWNLALDGITSSSTIPLRMWSYIGLTVSFFALSYGLFLLIHTMIQGNDVPGYASLMVAVLFLGGLNLFTLGILGEYVGRIVLEVKGRPLYLVRETYGLHPTSQQEME